MKRIVLSIILVAVPFLMKGQERFPDGTEIPQWFSDTSKIDVDALGTKYVITDYGVLRDSTLLQTDAIQKVIDMASEAGGGVVVIPEGTFLSGSLFFKEGTHLHLSEGAVLKGVDAIKHYPLVTTRIEGKTRKYFAALVNADGLDGFTITGQGTLDGNGLRFWEEFWIRREFNPDCTNLEALRPRLVYMSNCSNVTVQDVRLINSPFWTNHLYKCHHVRYLDCYIFAPTTGVRAPSSDALDIDFCHDILVDGCYMSVNDDAVVLKGGKGTFADQDPDNGPNYNVLVQNCTYGKVHGCLTLGSESLHDRNVILRNCTFTNADRVLWLKMRPDTPQRYEYVRVENVSGTCTRFLVIRPWTQFYELEEREDMPLSECDNISFKNVEAVCDNFFDVGASDKYVLRNFTFEDCTITDKANAFDPDLISGITVSNLVIVPAPTDLDRAREAFVETSVATYAEGEDVVSRFIESSDYGKANDVLLMQLYMSVYLPDAEVERLLGLFDFEEGCFTDIDYSSGEPGRWPATLHVTRMYSLAKLYVAGTERWKGSEELKALLHAAMGYWFKTMPVCPNWWHNEIGVPKKMAAVLLMLRDELSEEELAGGLKVLERSQFGKTGQNKAWLAGNNLMRGLLMDDEDLVIRARDCIAEEICITDGEGIRDDWSFQQHGPQIQFGNYGLAYADGIAFWCRVLAGTKYMFTDEQTELFSNFMKEGLCRCVFKGMMDPNFCGRQVFIDAGRGKVLSLAVAAQNMAVAMDRMAEVSEAAFYNAVSRENLYLTSGGSGLNGAKYFNRSDCGIYRTKDWYSSVRMHSSRTIGFEFTNNENTLANFSADGALLLMQDGDEYENVFACWDWRKVPGVTAYDDGKPIKCDDSEEGKLNDTDHVAGLTFSASAGDVMAASMELNRDGLHALKSDFFFSDCMVALGANISVTNPDFKEVTTAIDQTRLKGEVVFGGSVADDGEGVHTGVRWVQHNNRGYVSLDGSAMTVSEAVQKGKWDYIEPSFKEKWDEMPIFKCWFEHPLEGLKDGLTGSYAYAILPCSSVSDTEAFEKAVGGSDAPVKVLSNTADCQAVSHNGVVCAVVHKAGRYEFDGEMFETGKPCIIIREGDSVATEYFE